MNKKFLFGMFAAAGMLLATSCQNDELDTVQAGNEAKVTFSLGVEGGVQTRAISDGLTAKKLIYAVYDADGQLLNVVGSDNNGQFVDENAFENGLTDEVMITLAKGQTYTVLFWAQNGACTAYGTDDLTNVAIDYAGINNDETRDAFIAAVPFSVTGDNTVSVTLKRPFAQLNVGVTKADWEAAVASDVTVTESSVYIKNAGTAINLLSGKVTGSEDVEIKYTKSAIPSEWLEVNLDDQTAIDAEKEQFHWLSMSYILVNDGSEDGKSKVTLADVDFTFYSNREPIVLDEGLNNVPVQRNWRTNILGKLLTGDVTFNIVIDPIYDGDHNIEDGSYSNSEIAPGVRYDAPTQTFSVYSAEGLQWIADVTNGTKVFATTKATGSNSFEGYTVALTSDIDLKSVNWTPIGTENTFKGVFNGGNYTISNLNVNVTGNASAGLFATAQGEIKNVILRNVDVRGEYKTGAVVGDGMCSKINNCHVIGGYVTSKPNSAKDNGNHAGGIVGYLSAEPNAYVTNSSVKNLTITAYRDLGGIAGTSTGGEKAPAPIVENNEVDNVQIIANQMVEYCESGKDANASAIVGRNIKNSNLTANTANNVSIKVWAAGEKTVQVESVKELIALEKSGSLGVVEEIQLTEDIDLSNESYGDYTTFAPIGSTGKKDDSGRLITEYFEGTFDGGGHTIAGLKQSGWEMGYDYHHYGSVGLFSKLHNATVKNIVVEVDDIQIEGGNIGFIAGQAYGDCVFEDITIKSGSIGSYGNDVGGIVGYTYGGNYTFRNIVIEEDVVLGGLWGNFDCPIGGIVGHAEPGATYNFENVTVSCKIDAYNDCTAAYKYYNYRMCGMLIGRCEETTVVDGKNVPDLSKYNLSFNNVTVNYGDWMNYHYCATTGKNYKRVEPGYEYGGVADHDASGCENHMIVLPFDQLIGGAQNGVAGLREVSGVTVNYPASN